MVWCEVAFFYDESLTRSDLKGLSVHVELADNAKGDRVRASGKPS